MFNKNKKNNKGFTLVELLVVIAIIGILAVVAVPSLMKNIEKAKVADTTAYISAYKSAAVSLYADNPQATTITVEPTDIDSAQPETITSIAVTVTASSNTLDVKVTFSDKLSTTAISTVKNNFAGDTIVSFAN